MRRNRGGWKAYEWGDLVVLLDQNTQDNPQIYDISDDRGVPLFANDESDDQTGVIPIWAVSTPSAPYLLDPKGATGTIAPLGNKTCAPDSLQLKTNELVQVRVKLKLIDTFPASGAVIDDFSLSAFLPGSSAVWGTSNTAGVLSPRVQAGDPADSVSLPLQGSDMGGPAYAALTGFEVNDKTELFWYGVNSVPSFRLNYFGSGNTPAGIAVGLELSGYRYLLAAHPVGSGQRTAYRGGIQITIPDDVGSVDDILGVPIAGRAASS